MLAGTGTCPADDGLVNVNVTIPDLQVETTIRIGANPCLIVNRCSLTAKIRKGHQVSRFTLLALRKIGLFHGFHLPTKFLAVYTNS
jgi:hypothetical protein